MARSLNSDYLAQLFIRADTSKMDRQLVEGLLDGADLPDEAKALLVFKRGCAVFTAGPPGVCFPFASCELLMRVKKVAQIEFNLGQHLHRFGASLVNKAEALLLSQCTCRVDNAGPWLHSVGC